MSIEIRNVSKQFGDFHALRDVSLDIIDSPEHSQAQNAKAFAYVRPHDLDVERYSPGAGLDAEGRPRGIVAQLSRAIVVGPIARLELIPSQDHKPADNASPDSLIEAQIPAQQFKEQGFKEGETLVVTPRRARAPRRVLALISVACVGMLAFGMYLQHVVGLEPCPMCIVQRYALILVAVFAALASVRGSKGWWMGFAALALLSSGFGAFVAARQSWLQWYPPEVATCGRDFYGMIENYPISRAIPMIFRGSGDCSAIDWTFLGGSIANWSFICFVGFGLVLLALLVRGFKGGSR
eukprot:gene16995-16815_t